MPILSDKQLEQKIFELENKHERRLTREQREFLIADYHLIGRMPDDSVFKALAQRDADIGSDEKLKKDYEAEKSLIEKRKKKLREMFPTISI